MKGALKTIKRTPHLLGSKVGLANKSSDLEFDELNRRFTAMEAYAEKLHKDSIIFRDSVKGLISSSTAFATAFLSIFTPMGSERDLEARYPEAAHTIAHIGSFQTDMADLQETLAPELELIETRIIAPLKELIDLLKKVRKTIVKRDHKLVDFDRHNNSYSKLKDKTSKSLSDEKNLFKIEQDFEIASQEYEFHNSALKQELPQFFQIATSFITPLFESFYYMQLQCIYVMLERFQAFTGGKFDMSADIEQTYLAQLGDAAEQVDNLSITRRFASTAIMMRQHRTEGSSIGTGPRARATSNSSSTNASFGSSKIPPPPPLASKPSYTRSASGTGAAVISPPPYSPGSSGPSELATKRAPPPPPAAKPALAPRVETCVALYDFAAQADGDLSFSAGDRIELIEKTNSTEDWWTGRCHGATGSFPANYVQTS